MASMIFTRRFWPLFGAQTLGAFADNTLRMATIVATAAAFRLEAEAFALPYGMGEYAGSIVSAAFTLPVLIFSILGGQLADRISRSTMIRYLKVIEVILMVTAATLFALGNGLLLVATLFLMGTQSAFFSPVRNAVMPQYYGPTELVRANGYYNAALFVAIVAGLGLGGHFVNQDGGRLVVSGMLIGAAAAGAILAMFTPKLAPAGQDKIEWFIPAVIIRQYREVVRTPGLIYPMLGIGWFWMIGAIVIAILPNFVPETLGGTDTDLSLMQALFAIGAGCGSIVAGIAGSRMTNPLPMAGFGVIGSAIGALVIWYLSTHGATLAGGLFTQENLPLILALVGTSAMNGVFAVPLMAAIQRRAPEATRARVMGVSNTTNGALATLGALVVIPIRMVGVTPAAMFLVLAGMQLALFAFMAIRYQRIRAAALVGEMRPST